MTSCAGGVRVSTPRRKRRATRASPKLVTQIWDRDGVLVYWSQPGMGASTVPATEGYSTINHGGRDWRVYTLVQGTHALQVAEAQDEREAIATQTALRTLVPFLALIPFFGVLTWVGVGRGLAPLEAMSRAVAKRRPNAMAPLEERALPDELQPLGASLNGLLEAGFPEGAGVAAALPPPMRRTSCARRSRRSSCNWTWLGAQRGRRSWVPRSTISKRVSRARRTSSSS